VKQTKTEAPAFKPGAQGLEQMLAYYKRSARIKVFDSALDVLKKAVAAAGRSAPGI
jgi:hypothetical protein